MCLPLNFCREIHYVWMWVEVGAAALAVAWFYFLHLALRTPAPLHSWLAIFFSCVICSVTPRWCLRRWRRLQILSLQKPIIMLEQLHACSAQSAGSMLLLWLFILPSWDRSRLPATSLPSHHYCSSRSRCLSCFRQLHPGHFSDRFCSVGSNPATLGVWQQRVCAWLCFPQQLSIYNKLLPHSACTTKSWKLWTRMRKLCLVEEDEVTVESRPQTARY